MILVVGSMSNVPQEKLKIGHLPSWDIRNRQISKAAKKKWSFSLTIFYDFSFYK